MTAILAGDKCPICERALEVTDAIPYAPAGEDALRRPKRAHFACVAGVVARSPGRMGKVLVFVGRRFPARKEIR